MTTTTHIQILKRGERIVGVYAHTRPEEAVKVRYPKNDRTKGYLVLTLGTIKVSVSNERSRELALAILSALDTPPPAESPGASAEEGSEEE